MGQQFALGAGDKAAPPEVDAAADAGAVGLVVDPVGHDHRHAIGDCVASLDQRPGLLLAGLFIVLIDRVPADGRGVEQQLGSGQGHQPRRFRIPLVPAHQQAESTDRGVDRREALTGAVGVARREVKFLVEARVIGDMHLAVVTHATPPAIIDHGGVVIEAGGAAFEERAHQHDLELRGQCRQAAAGGAVQGLGEVEQLGILVLTEIVGGVQLLQHDQFGTGRGQFTDAGLALGEASGLVGPAGLLDQADLQVAGHGDISSFQQVVVAVRLLRGSCMVRQCRLPC